MARKRFDPNTRALLDEAQSLIDQINARLLNPSEKSREQLKKVKESLRDRIKELKLKYYEASNLALLNEGQSLISKIQSYNVSNIIKY